MHLVIRAEKQDDVLPIERPIRPGQRGDLVVSLLSQVVWKWDRSSQKLEGL